ncbi:TetR family transcriptional regulator protein [Scytonema sp. HK-05]|uniref:TetR/AcrR family transcriptional regulator n=1 Tax=Scytonema sp. HK-05 TaxID=1137095 RepID=UPI00093625F4|nr:TetR/AcrR family transcriptional regulator [Scytonema sp. HK-05]OKH58717.1 hypothetical protein NIES2130_12600 [Scytonema sp. HK-05]BAY43381.1 TetR family transcriptional regulator protein [Scytonema sp. HK-05]
MTNSRTGSVRTRILDTACTLFYQEGIRAVGVDKIIEDSGVAKMTLYRHFPTKDNLVVAYLEERKRIYWVWFEEVMSRHPGSPKEQLLDLFDALGEKLTSPGYRGCPFLNTTTEFPDPEHPGHRITQEHKCSIRNRLRDLAESAGTRHPDKLATQLQMLIDGAHVSAQIFGKAVPVSQMQAAAALLIAAHLPQNANLVEIIEKSA